MPWDVLDDADKMDPYKVLRVPFLSSREQIRKAYVRLCRQEHPDLHGGQESMEWLMGEWAYRVLSAAEDKAAYDTARVLRNALCATEGVVAFAFAASVNIGSFLSDAWNVAEHMGKEWLGTSRQIESAVDSRPEERVEPKEEAPAEEKQDHELSQTMVQRMTSRNSSRDEYGNYVPLTLRAERISGMSESALAGDSEALQMAVAEQKLAEGKARLRKLVAKAGAQSEGQQESGSLMGDINVLRDDIAQLRQDIRVLAKDAGRARSRLASLQNAEATV